MDELHQVWPGVVLQMLMLDVSRAAHFHPEAKRILYVDVSPEDRVDG